MRLPYCVSGTLSTAPHGPLAPRKPDIGKCPCEVNIFSDSEPAPRYTLCSNDLDLRLAAPAFLRHLQELHRKLSDLESRPLPSSIPASAEFNAMATETRALLSLYAEFGRQLTSLEVTAADQTWPTPC